MALKSKRKKPGPRTPWQLRAKYQRARCNERLKPNQIENLAAADAFARWLRTPLNCFVTVHFFEQPDPKRIFETGIDRLSKWHKRWGGEWTAIHAWEATGGFHIHMACHRPKNSDAVHSAITTAFSGCDVHICTRARGQGMMAYLCKGTDVVTHAKIRGPCTIKARLQGVISWKRCGTTQNIGKSARQMTGFEVEKHQNICVKTSPPKLNAHASQRTEANTDDGNYPAFPTLIVSQTLKTRLHDDYKFGSRERVASGVYDASRHTLPESLCTRTHAQAWAMRTTRTT